jgi:hypothetical protein
MRRSLGLPAHGFCGAKASTGAGADRITLDAGPVDVIRSRRTGVEAEMYALATDTFFPALAAGGRPGGKVIALAPGRLRVSLDRGAEGGARLSALVVAIAERGDREAFTLLFNHFAPRVKSYLLRMGATAETAEELAQETLLTVWRRAGGLHMDLHHRP